MFRNTSVGSVFIELLLYEQDKRAFVYVTMPIVRDVFGKISKSININVLPINIDTF